MSDDIDRRTFAVLVVEDDPLLLIDAIDMVEDAGFTAYGARSADAAIEMMEAHPDIRVLFTDVDMPGSMDGLKLAKSVRDRWPPVTIMVTSGLRHVQKSEMPDHGLFFAKPYPPNSVVKALNKVATQVDL